MLKVKNNHLEDDRISQIVSWGHWFTLFNIFVVAILGSKYLFIADWPRTFMGRFYAIISGIGHFSFLTFFTYLILLFPLSFFIRSSRLQRIIAVIFATLGISLLLIDTEIFAHFRMHLNLSIWTILTASDASFLSSAFVLIPLVLLLEILFAIWSWKKLRMLNKRRIYAKFLVVICIACFVASHLIHIWADANFYRPITMQRSSLPLSYPLTARHFLERYGFIDEGNYQNRLKEEGNPFAIAIEYPLGKINYQPPQPQYNVLMIVIDGWNNDLLNNNMPWLHKFAQDNIQFTNHYSASGKAYLSDFSLFYGLDPNYYHSILASHKSSVLLDTVSKQRYNLGLFSSEGFAQPLYRHALLSNFTLPEAKRQSNKQTTDYWMTWHDTQNNIDNHAPLFSIVQYSLAESNKKMKLSTLETDAKKLDQYLESLIAYMKLSNEYENTIIVITGSNGLLVDKTNNAVTHSSGSNFNREQLKVPLIMVWPNKASTQITTETTHTDIMSTLMQDVLNVTSPVKQYSQGNNLFSQHTESKRQWIIAASESEIAALYNDKTVVLDAFGRSKIYDANYNLEKNTTISLPLFLQIVSENRRFMVMDN